MEGDGAAQTATIELFRKCVVRIPKLGTGFFVAPNCVLTCSHLFKDHRGTTVDILWQGHTGTAAIHCQRTLENQDLPDLALLEVDWNSPRPDGHPCAMLGDEAEWRQDLLAFGHPPGRFEENGDSLELTYGWKTEDNHGVGYVKTPGQRVVAGFSGSPVLNLSTQLVCGVIALSLNVQAAEGGRILPTRLAVDSFSGLAEKQRLYQERVTEWPDLLPGARLWRHVWENCRHNVEIMRSTFEAASDALYTPRQFEAKFSSFVDSDKSAIVIVGQSGMGKTTMLARLLVTYFESGHLCMMIQSDRLPPTNADVESYTLDKLQRLKLDWKEFWRRISVECKRRSKRLILFIDAVNEYQKRAGGARPIDLVEKLDKLIWDAANDYPGLKFVITCRPETWRMIERDESAVSRFAETEMAYYREGVKGGLAHELPRFSEDELRDAYGKYKGKREIQTSFATLSELARYDLRDPFLLELTTQTYEGREIPGDLDTGEVFRRYRAQVGDSELIDDIVQEMFAKETEDQEPDVVRRTTIRLSETLRQRAPSLYEALRIASMDSAGYRLRNRNVLRAWKSRPEEHEAGNAEVVEIRFTYDRFAEFLLADALIERFRHPGSGTAESAALRLIRLNLDGAQHMNIVLGALQRMLLMLQSERCDYVKVLQESAEGDPRGLGLVVSVLARTARASAGGIDVLERLLRNLERRGRSAKRVSSRFPLIDAVYRVLQNEEYRLWLKERPSDEQARHFSVLHGYFRWGFQHREATVSATAIQYLSFLWRGRTSTSSADAEAITAGLVALVSPLSIASYVFHTGKRRLLQNLASLMVLIIGEAQEESRALPALAAAKDLVVRLRLRKSTAFRLISPLNRTLSRQLVSVLKRLRNPVTLKALQAFFVDFSQNLRDFEAIIDIFSVDGGGDELAHRVRELARNGNSFILEMLALTLSSYHERRAAAGSAEDCLALLEELFTQDGASAGAQYCASLALYHINYFGDYATRESLALMGRVAAVILQRHKGVFALGGGMQNFNIIGTYGRALQKNGRLLADASVGSMSKRALQYAIDALEQAKAEGDFSYYLYVCENVGLLGILIEPGQVLDVISKILTDIGAIKQGEGEARLFTSGQRDEARERILRSLANIRVLYRQEIDKYLLDELESTELYGEVANNLIAEFSIETFYSWAFEQLTFRVLTKYYDQVGRDVLRAFVDGVRSGSVGGCLEVIVGRVVPRLSEISA
jgi:Trypsin-like peptidase domain/NACHT domain